MMSSWGVAHYRIETPGIFRFYETKTSVSVEPIGFVDRDVNPESGSSSGFPSFGRPKRTPGGNIPSNRENCKKIINQPPPPPRPKNDYIYKYPWQLLRLCDGWICFPPEAGGAEVTSLILEHRRGFQAHVKRQPGKRPSPEIAGLYIRA